MNINEAYQVMQTAWVKEFNVRVGDKVRCIRHFGRNELGSCASGSKNLGLKALFIDDKAVGVIAKINSDHIDVNCGEKYYYGWNFPFFVLEIVERSKVIRKEVRYFDENNNDITDKISDETKANL